MKITIDHKIWEDMRLKRLLDDISHTITNPMGEYAMRSEDVEAFKNEAFKIINEYFPDKDPNEIYDYMMGLGMHRS